MNLGKQNGLWQEKEQSRNTALEEHKCWSRTWIYVKESVLSNLDFVKITKFIKLVEQGWSGGHPGSVLMDDDVDDD